MTGLRAVKQRAYLCHELSAETSGTLAEQNPQVVQTFIAQVPRQVLPILCADDGGHGWLAGDEEPRRSYR
jgi:hypothetical protein